MQPGYLPMRPNGDPMFRGSQFNSRINGGQAMATENFFDGAAFGYASGHQQSHESTPPVESVQEVKVITTTYSAQYGHTSGGFIDYTSKSGTNAFHGILRVHVAMTRSTRTPCSPSAAASRRRRFATTTTASRSAVRSPRPNKTHFFTNVDFTRIRSGTIAGFGNTTPIDAFKNGDFGALLTNNRVGTDALGRPIMQGQIFDPQTTRTGQRHSGARSVPGQRHPRRSPAAKRCRLADRAADGGPGPRRARQQRRRRRDGGPDVGVDARNIMGRVDHNFTPNFKASSSFYWNRRPSVRNCEGVDGSLRERSRDGAAKNTGYYGSGFFQRISTHHAHQQFDWVISNNLLSHSTVAWDRWFMGGNHLSAGANWPQRLWEGTASPTGGIVAQDAGPPTMRFNGGSVPYTPIGLRDGRGSASRRTTGGSSRATSRG